MAYLGLLNARDIARKRAASDLLHAMLQDAKLGDAIKTFSIVARSDKVSLVDFAGQEHDKTTAWLGSKESPLSTNKRHVDVAGDILHLLCYYDFIASGIKRRVYDEDVLKDSLYSRVTKYCEYLNGFIDTRKAATGQETMFQDFKALAERWLTQGVPKKPQRDDFNKVGFFEKIINSFGEHKDNHAITKLPQNKPPTPTISKD